MKYSKSMESSSCWRGTSYEKLIRYTDEVIELAQLRNHQIEFYMVPIVMDQDYGYIYDEDDAQQTYRYHEYNEVSEEHKELYQRTKAQ